MVARSFTVEDLVLRRLPQALPLLRATWPTIDLAGWQRFAEAFACREQAGASITGMFDSSGGLCGLFVSRVEHRLRERVLAIPLFTVVDIANSQAPVRALLDGVEARAKSCGCTIIEVRLDTGQTELVKRLRSFGLNPVGTMYASPIVLDQYAG